MDPFDAAFGNIGADFEANCSGLAFVTVSSIDPESGEVDSFTQNVPALKRVTRYGNTGAGGGKVGATACRFTVRVQTVGFAIKPRDEIRENDGTTWFVDDAENSVSYAGFGQLAQVNVTLKRADTQ